MNDFVFDLVEFIISVLMAVILLMAYLYFFEATDLTEEQNNTPDVSECHVAGQ